MSNDIPTTSIEKQSQASTPVVSDATLVDDTVALVDDTVALVGGKAVTVPLTRSTAEALVPRFSIKIRR
mgnify:CR=1 FL=1